MYIDDFTLLYPIESGTYSTVWKVKYKDKKFALKMVSKANLATKLEKKMLKTEIKIHKPLKHENIIRLHYFFEDDFFLYIVMELADDDLFNFFRRKEPITEVEILHISYQIVKGMLYLHEKEVIHSDLKLENILMVGNKVKICDFGLSSQNSYHYGYVGTPEFMAPEIILKEVYTDKVDVWSFGIILYHLVFGMTPFYVQFSSGSVDRQKTQYKICHSPLTLPYSTPFNNLISKCLQKNPIERLSIEELYHDDLFSKFKV